MSKPDMSKMAQIGQGRAYQDPQDAIRSVTGEYHDQASEMTLEQKLPFASFPMAPAPMPFGALRRAGGSR